MHIKERMLPNKEKAYIPLTKLKDYLLSETHSIGESKAKLLRSLGFSLSYSTTKVIHFAPHA